MINKIKDLEKIARLLEPDTSERELLLNQVITYANRYLEAKPE